MSKTEIKQNAQDRIMTGMRMEYSCFVEEVERASDDTVDVTTTTQTCIEIAEMQRQMNRVAKLFGYDVPLASYGI